MDKKGIDAYFTVEAALVIPMAIGTMVFIIYTCFYLYGRCILTQDIYIMSFRASQITKEMGTTPQNYVLENSEKILGQRYFGNNRPEIKTEVKGKEITVSAQNSTRHRALSNYFLMPNGAWGYRSKGKAYINDPPGSMRLKKRLLDLYKTVKE
ncbi:MAG: hypothetical protein K6A23_16190 [Butyrivibrio sp.]|nr:hypothetical protein [Butyrivibrio sp.]